jgi:hypothetical protein
MALTGIGSQGGSPLEKFQQARDLARKKLDGEDSRAKLAELLSRKQAEIGGVSAKPKPAPAEQRAKASAIFPGLTGADAKPPVAGPAGYGRAGATEKPDPKPKLGRYVDFMA